MDTHKTYVAQGLYIKLLSIKTGKQKEVKKAHNRFSKDGFN